MEKKIITDKTRAFVAEASKAARDTQKVLRVKNLLQAGICHYLDYALLGIDEVGVVIVNFNPDSSERRALKNIARFGYQTVAETKTALNKGQIGGTQKERRQLRRDIAEVEYGFRVKYGIGQSDDTAVYESPFFYSDVEINGFMQVQVTRDGVFEACARAQKLSAKIPVAEALKVVRDMEAIKRFFGEKTIDSAKKPDKDIMGGIPLMDNMKRVKMRSRTPLTLTLNWDSRRAVVGGFKKDPNRDTELIKKVNKDGSVTEFVDLNDMWNQSRSEFFGYAKEVADELMRVSGQQLPREEVLAITMAVKKHGDVVRALALLKQILQSASTALARKKAEYESLYKKGSYRAEAWAKTAKAENNELYPDVRNQARLICELGKVNDPVERVRCALATVLFQNLDTKSKINWDKLSGFVSNALDVEWQIYKLHVEKSNPWTPQETMDKVSFVDGIEATDEILAAINETSAEFVNGAVYDEDGEEILVGNVELNGEFTIRVADDGIYACRNLTEVLTGLIPKADPSRVLFVTKGGKVDIEAFKSAVVNHSVTLAPWNKDAIIMNDNGKLVEVGKFRTEFMFKAFSSVTMALYGDKQGKVGTVTKVIKGFYDSKAGREEIAICTLCAAREASETEAEHVVPVKSVRFEKKKPVFNFNGPAVGFDNLF